MVNNLQIFLCSYSGSLREEDRKGWGGVCARDWRQEAWSDLVMFTKIIIILVLILWSEWVLIIPITAWSIIFLEWRYVETCWPDVQLTRHSKLRCTVNMTIASRPHRKRQQLQFQTIEELKCNKLQQSTTVLLFYAAWVAVTAPTSKRCLTHHHTSNSKQESSIVRTHTRFEPKMTRTSKNFDAAGAISEHAQTSGEGVICAAECRWTLPRSPAPPRFIIPSSIMLSIKSRDLAPDKTWIMSKLVYLLHTNFDEWVVFRYVGSQSGQKPAPCSVLNWNNASFEVMFSGN